MKQYTTTHLVKSEDLNHHGTLFAARMASWFVEAAFVAAATEHKEPAEIVCRNLHGMSFRTPVRNGALLQLTSRVVFTGETSMMVYVHAEDLLRNEPAVEGFMTFVTVDRNTGKKITHAVRLDEAADAEEQAQREEALRVRAASFKN